MRVRPGVTKSLEREGERHQERLRHRVRDKDREEGRGEGMGRELEKRRKKKHKMGTSYIYPVPSLNPRSVGALPSSFGRADVNSLTGLGSKCLIRSGKK